MSKNLKKTNLSRKECSKGTKFKVLSDLAISKAEKALIWDRAGFFTRKERSVNYTICEEHFDQLFQNFNKNKVCRHPDHELVYKKWWQKSKGGKAQLVCKIGRQTSMEYYRHFDKLIPDGGALCSSHKVYVWTELKKARKDNPIVLEEEAGSGGSEGNEAGASDPPQPETQEEPFESSDHDIEPMPASGSESESFKSSPVKSDPDDPDFKMTDDDIKAALKERITILNKLLEENNMQQRFARFMDVKFNSVKHRSKMHWLKLLGSAVAAVLHSMTKHQEDDIEIWSSLVESKLVEKNLKGKLKPNALLQQVIIAYNSTTSRRYVTLPISLKRKLH